MSGGVGLLMLCEAVLGNPMYEIPSGDSNAEAESKKHNCVSTLGVGRTVPQDWKDAECVHENLKGVLMVSSLDRKDGMEANENSRMGNLETTRVRKRVICSTTSISHTMSLSCVSGIFYGLGCRGGRW